MNTQSEAELSKAYEFLKAGEYDQAGKILNKALEFDLGNKEILYTIRCMNFWRAPLARAEKLSSPYEKAETLISEWKNFMGSVDSSDGQKFERSIYAIRHGIFSMALAHYDEILNSSSTQPNIDLYRKAGLCYKKLGDYETALRYLESANSICADSAAILAEMADCYTLCGEERTAKVLFREAFFIEPQRVDLSFLDSELICYLIKQTAELGYGGKELQEWIPVYGVLFGVFNIKRELRALEIGKLKQSIFSLENEMNVPGSDASVLKPRLINHYFWLIDHYITVNEERKKVDEILRKLKALDLNVYEKYTM